MEPILYILAKTVQLFLSAVSTCMFLTVIMQFFADPENKIYRFFNTVSELFVFPFRVLLAKLNLFQGLPIDMPFLVAYISISLISMFLPIL